MDDRLPAVFLRPCHALPLWAAVAGRLRPAGMLDPRSANLVICRPPRFVAEGTTPHRQRRRTCLALIHRSFLKNRCSSHFPGTQENLILPTQDWPSSAKTSAAASPPCCSSWNLTITKPRTVVHCSAKTIARNCCDWPWHLRRCCQMRRIGRLTGVTHGEKKWMPNKASRSVSIAVSIGARAIIAQSYPSERYAGSPEF